ncbi:MAG: CRISPR-associated HD domain protein [Acetothermia bacterium 64_32]|nr:MAG: CRISPR-associated HD domain protein [Acetothermia bacterium 64_32]
MAQAEARPGQPLIEHLAQVAEGAREALTHPALRRREVLARIAYLVGAAHDAGKYTTFFQTYLRTKKPQDGKEHHAFLSAVLAAWWTMQEVSDPDLETPQAYLPLLAFLMVHRHHGHLHAPTELIPKPDQVEAWLNGDLDNLETYLRHFWRQWHDLHTRREDVLAELRDLDAPDPMPWFADPKTVAETFKHLGRLAYWLDKPASKLDEDDRARLALWGQLLFSALIDADKRSAAGLPLLPPRPDLPGDLVARYVAHKYAHPRHDLDRERGKFFCTVTEQACQVPIPPREPLALTAPTGMGKTLAALSAAFVLRERLAQHYGVAPRIVYALPFINLIEQNFRVVRDVLTWGVHDFKANQERYLLRHHHLAEIGYRVEDENLPVAEALLLTEGWESEIIVTTFVQVFHTLLGYQNRMLRKLHNLIGAVLVLDELQSLPMEYWDAVDRVFRVLQEEMGLTVLQMTATRPLVFLRVRELHPNPPRLFSLMRRTVMEVNLEPRSAEVLADEVEALAEDHGSVLVVVNTVRTSLELCQALRKRGLGQPVVGWTKGDPFPLPRGQRALVYLSTNIVPKHRRERLDFLKAWLAAGEQAVLVATQVVEAGVDVDFPVVVRDLAPLDAVIQAAGRCNREGKRQQGLVLVRRLENSGATRVYGPVHIYVAERLLGGSRQLPEPKYAVLVERYFQETRERKSQQKSRDLWDAYVRLRYDFARNRADLPCLSDFQLIEQMPSIPVYVSLCAEDEKWLREVFSPQVLEEKDWRRRQEAYIHYRYYLHERMLQIPEFRAKKNPPPVWNLGLYWIPYGQRDQYYDLETGFRWAKDELEKAWIV